MTDWRCCVLWVVPLLAISVNGLASFGTMRMEMAHRHSHRAAGKVSDEMPERTQLERVKELLASDGLRERLRRQAWETGGGRRWQNASTSGEVPIKSAADFGTGQYLVTLRVGTPAQRLSLIADTGSDLTWVKCLYRRRCGPGGGGGECAVKRSLRRRRRRRVFRADGSSSFRAVPCFSELCRVELVDLFARKQCPTPLTPCAYNYSYFDGSAASGIFANETVTLSLTSGRKKRLQNMLVGCTETARGQSFRSADGVLGLGFSKFSFVAKAARSFGGKFSYCLVDHLSPRNVSNYLTFGMTTKHNVAGKMRFTDLVLGVLSSFYAVNVLGVSVGSVMLNIPAEVWDVNRVGGTILDSGSSLAFLSVPAYKPLMAALTPSIAKFRKVDLGISSLEHCFNSTGFNESMVPRLAFHFSGGARFQPPVKSYVIDAADGVKCLGFVSVAWPGYSVIGNIMQQNHLWEFDLMRNRVGFIPSDCS